MTRSQALDILMLLSSLETWCMSLGKPMPDHLADGVGDTIERLRAEILNAD